MPRLREKKICFKSMNVSFITYLISSNDVQGTDFPLKWVKPASFPPPVQHSGG